MMKWLLKRQMKQRFQNTSLICLIMLWWGIGTSLWGADLQVQVSIDRNQIPANQVFAITIEVSGDGAAQAQIQPQFPPAMNNFSRLLGRGGESSNIQFVNGKMSVSRSIQYNFLAVQVGKFEIESFKVEVGDKTYQTNAFTLEIVKGAPQPSAPSTPSRNPQSTQPDNFIEGNLFVKAFVNKRTVYQHEPIIVTYKIYTRVNVTSYSIDKLPNTSGFWQEEFEMPAQPRLYTEVVNGQKFSVAEIRKVALFPTDVGEKTVEPLVLSCDVRVQARRRSTDFFDSFFDDPFSARTQRYSIASPPLAINVIPLPAENKPRNFSGVVGQFTLSATVDKADVETNEAIKLKIKLSGEGNIKMLPNPVVEIPDEFERYGPTTSETIKRENNQIAGTKTIEYVLIPRYSGEKVIKLPDYSFFNLATKSYTTLHTNEIPINVRKGKNGFMAATSGFSREEIKIIGQDIRYIQQHLPEFSPIGTYFYQKFSFIILVIAPLIGLGVAIAYRQHRDKLSDDRAYARFRKASNLANQRLKNAKKVLNEATQKEFYAEVARALLSFVANKLNLDEAGMMSDQVTQLLESRRVPAKTIQQYLTCLQTCDYQRFAPATARIEEMKQFYEQARVAITDLQKAL
ncbi:BatD family protein [candidate division KSB1 bacterium]|nr:BatD family protein [candidate division KSB1 bacterium]